MDARIEDVYGNIRMFKLDPKTGLYIPPFMQHSFGFPKDSSFMVVANTLFNPQDPTTHDTYSYAAFTRLQEQYR